MNPQQSHLVLLSRQLLHPMRKWGRIQWLEHPDRVACLVFLYQRSGLTPTEFSAQIPIKSSSLVMFLNGKSTTKKPWSQLQEFLFKKNDEELYVKLFGTHLIDQVEIPVLEEAAEDEMETDQVILTLQKDIEALRAQYTHIPWEKHPELLERIRLAWENSNGQKPRLFMNRLGVHREVLRRHLGDNFARIRAKRGSKKPIKKPIKKPPIKASKNPPKPKKSESKKSESKKSESNAVKGFKFLRLEGETIVGTMELSVSPGDPLYAQVLRAVLPSILS